MRISLIILCFFSPLCIAQSLCSKQEKIVFSCQMGKKIVSFCEGAKEDYLEYRYGTKNKRELTYTVSKDNPDNKIFFKIRGFEYIYFKNNGRYYFLNLPLKALPNLEVRYQNEEIFFRNCNTMESNEYKLSRLFTYANADDIE